MAPPLALALLTIFTIIRMQVCQQGSTNLLCFPIQLVNFYRKWLILSKIRIEEGKSSKSRTWTVSPVISKPVDDKLGYQWIDAWTMLTLESLRMLGK